MELGNKDNILPYYSEQCTVSVYKQDLRAVMER